MILGMSISTYTTVHVVISLVGILSGFIVLFGLLADKRLDGWTALFLVTTVATSMTGFAFPFHGFGPPHYVGMISLVVLALAIVARYPKHLDGGWRKVYVITSVIALYLNSFVGVVQAFQKIPTLHTLAPKGNEPPFAAAQLVLLVIFVVLGVMATRRFRGEPRRP